MTESTPADAVAAGHRFYTARMLRFYDPLILGWFSRTAWRCPSSTLLAHYDAHVSANHLDVGVGTGYFLDRCSFPGAHPRLALMDLNEDCLAAASRRTVRYAPEVHVANVLEPIKEQTSAEIAPFDSIGMTYLLHCLPGDMAAKSVAFEHLVAVANPGATVFGATLLAEGVPRNWHARQVMAFNNRRGIFSNTADSLDSLHTALQATLTDVQLRTVGCVALFSGRTPA